MLAAEPIEGEQLDHALLDAAEHPSSEAAPPRLVIRVEAVDHDLARRKGRDGLAQPDDRLAQLLGGAHREVLRGLGSHEKHIGKREREVDLVLR